MSKYTVLNRETVVTHKFVGAVFFLKYRVRCCLGLKAKI